MAEADTQGATKAVEVISSRLEGAERRNALDKVGEIQETRETRGLKASEVPNILLPYQGRWHADKASVRLCEKSRRIGFSWGALAAEAALEAATAREHGGMSQHYMGYNQAMAAEFIGDVAFFAKAFGAAIGAIDVWKDTEVIENERRDILRYRVDFTSGFKVEALSSAPHNWRGRQGHARVDEAAFHRNLKEVLKGAMAFLMWGGRVDIVSTHNGEDNDFNELVRDCQEGKLPWSRHKVTFDDALRAGFYRRVCLIRQKPWSAPAEVDYRRDIYAAYPVAEDAQEELDCIAKRGSGTYFSRMLVESCAEEGIPVLRLSKAAEFVLDPRRKEVAAAWIADHLAPVIDALPGKRSVVGQDFGRSGDLSDIWVLQEEAPARWRTAFLLELRNIPFDVQQQILFHVLDHLPLFHHAKFDARGNGQSHAEAALQRYGPAHVECVMLTAGWYAEWFPKYRQAYEGRNLVVPKDEDIIADHRQVVLRAGQPGMSDARHKGSDGQYRHGDSAVAGLLAYVATQQEGEPAAGATVPPAPQETYDTRPAGGLRLGLAARRPEGPFKRRF